VDRLSIFHENSDKQILLKISSSNALSEDGFTLLGQELEAWCRHSWAQRCALVFKKEVKGCGIEDHVRSHIKSKRKVDQVLVLFCKDFSDSWIVIEEVAV
jgi:hypothetical protein